MKHQPRKRFGQHFLVDQGVLHAIVQAIDPRPGQALVEIGPGLGALTAPVLERCQALTVVELDRDLAARLRHWKGLEVVEGDILQVDPARLCGGRLDLRIIGNLPYNVSTPILFHLMASADRVLDQHFMLQREVVQRMVASPGGKDYGRLSVMLQWRYAMEQVLDVPPEAFDPPPAVESAVVRMEPLACTRIGQIDPKALSELVTIAFSQRRKLLRHTLGRWLGERGYSGQFDTQRRAEEVPVDQYVTLAADLAADRASVCGR